MLARDPEPDSNGAQAASDGRGVGAVALSFSIFNLMVGSGTYCLPYAALGVPMRDALATIAFVGASSAITFALLGIFCARTGASSLDDLWRRAGPPLKLPTWFPQAIAALYTLGVCVQIQISLARLLSRFLPWKDSLGALLPAVIASDPSRLTILLTAPLLLWAMLAWRDLRALAPASAVGLPAKVFAASVVLLRAADGSYARGSGRFAAAAAAAATPAAPAAAPASASLLSLCSTMCYLYVCHQDVPRFYASLKPARRSPRVFSAAALGAFAAGVTVYSVVLACTRALFGEGVSDFALNSFARTDRLASAAQLALALGAVPTFLLIMFSLRSVLLQGAIGDGLARLLRVAPRAAERRPDGAQPSAATQRALDTRLTLLLFALNSAMALSGASRLLLVVALCGALCGSTTCFVIPALTGLGLSRRQRQRPTADESRGVDAASSAAAGAGASRWEQLGLSALFVAGLLLTIAATVDVVRTELLS